MEHLRFQFVPFTPCGVTVTRPIPLAPVLQVLISADEISPQSSMGADPLSCLTSAVLPRHTEAEEL